ncbi:MAG: Ig domain-containing protein [Bacteroidales bacterium]|nr:Ig domain-containing protein [Bacteroidales bacterium]
MSIRNIMAAVLLVAAGCTPDIHIDRIVLEPHSLFMAVGDTQTLQVHFLSDAEDAVQWYTDNKDVATVSSSGTVTAVLPGTATVTARSVKGGLLASCEVLVRGYREELVSGVKLDCNELSLYLGDGYIFQPTVLPETAINKKLAWRSSDKSVVTVNASGVLTTEGEGTAEITVTTEEGGFTDSCSITVLPAFIHVQMLYIPQTLHIAVGESELLELTLLPEDATNPSVSWASLDESIVTVTQEGVVTGIAPGTAHVKVTAEDGDLKSYCLVTVSQ